MRPRWLVWLVLLGGCHWVLPLGQRDDRLGDTGRSEADGPRAADALGIVEGQPPKQDLPALDLGPQGSCAKDSPGCVSTLAGVCDKNPLPFKNGPAASATFNKPRGLAWDKASGTLYVADSQNHCIRVVDKGNVSTLAGKCGQTGELNQPRGLVLDPDKPPSLLVADTMSHRIRRIALPSGAMTTLAGSGKQGKKDGGASTAEFNQPQGLALYGSTVYVADTLNDEIRLILAGAVTTLVKPPALDGPTGIVATGLNQLLVTDTQRHTVVRTISSTVSPVAGSTKGLQDGGAKTARFNEPAGIVLVHPEGEPVLFVADEKNHRIRAVTLGKKAVVTAAGTVAGHVDGFWDKAAFRFPSHVVAGPPGVLFVADTGNHCIRHYRLQ